MYFSRCYTKNESPAELSLMNYKTIKHVPLAAVNGRKLLGVAVGEWDDIVFLQCSTQGAY